MFARKRQISYSKFLDDIESTAPISNKVVKLNEKEYYAYRAYVSSIKWLMI